MPTTIPQPLVLWEFNNALTDATGGGRTFTNSTGSYTTGLLGGSTGARSSSASRSRVGDTALADLATATHALSLWFKWDFVDNVLTVTINKTTGAGNGFKVYVSDDASTPARTILVNNVEVANVDSAYIANGWNHLIYSCNRTNNTLQIILNGVSVYNSIIPTNASGGATNFSIGSAGATITNDQYAVWTQALTEDQMLAVCNSMSGIEWTSDPWESPYGAGPPDAPVLSGSQTEESKVSLSWTTPADNGDAITQYEVWGDINGAGWGYIATVSAPSTVYDDTQSVSGNGEQRYYSVRATNGLGTSADSNTLSVVMATAPVVSDLTLVAPTADGASVVWTPPTEYPTLAHQLNWRSTPNLEADNTGASYADLSANVGEYTITGLTPGTYYAAVYASNDFGYDWSNEISFTVPSPGGGSDDDDALLLLLL